MKILKQILINSTTAIITIAVIGSAYAAISTVSSGAPLTADSWNQIVNKFDGIGENSVKEYVDATVSANSGGYPVTNAISQKSPIMNDFSSVLNYCGDLSEGEFNDRRVPSIDELMRYVYILDDGDDDIFWSYTLAGHYSNYYITFNTSQNRFGHITPSSPTAKVRCVR